MALAVFDTHTSIKHFVERLTAAGMEDKLAVVLAEEQMNVIMKALDAASLASDAVSQTEFRAHKANVEKQDSDLFHAIESLRKDMELLGARFERLLLRAAIILAAISLVSPHLGVLARLFY